VLKNVFLVLPSTQIGTHPHTSVHRSSPVCVCVSKPRGGGGIIFSLSPYCTSTFPETHLLPSLGDPPAVRLTHIGTSRSIFPTPHPRLDRLRAPPGYARTTCKRWRDKNRQRSNPGARCPGRRESAHAGMGEQTPGNKKGSRTRGGDST